MKFRNEYGEEIECSVEEYRELHKNNNKSLIIPMKIEEDNDYVNDENNDKIILKIKWSQKENKFLRDNSHSVKNASELANLFIQHFGNKRTKEAINYHISHYGFMKRKNWNRKKQSDRLKFIHSKAKFYMKEFNMNFEKARVMAMDAYNANVNNAKLIMPLWDNINPDSRSNFEEIVRMLINKEISKIEFDMMYDIKLLNGYFWNLNVWDELLTWFILTSDKISKYLKVDNNFRVVNNSIVYEA